MKNPFFDKMTVEELNTVERAAPNSKKCIEVINTFPKNSTEEFYMQNLLIAYVNACLLVKELRENK